MDEAYMMDCHVVAFNYRVLAIARVLLIIKMIFCGMSRYRGNPKYDKSKSGVTPSCDPHLLPLIYTQDNKSHNGLDIFSQFAQLPLKNKIHQV